MTIATATVNTILDSYITDPAAFYIGYGTAAPGNDGSTAAEPVGNGYGRQNATSSWAAAASRSKATNAAVTFATSTGAQGTITHLYFYSAVTAGTFLGFGALASSIVIGTGDSINVPAGNLTITLT